MHPLAHDVSLNLPTTVGLMLYRPRGRTIRGDFCTFLGSKDETEIQAGEATHIAHPDEEAAWPRGCVAR
jgi:hypothetical protein